MRKNIKSLIETYEVYEPTVLFDMTDGEILDGTGLALSDAHAREGEGSALWACGKQAHVSLPTGGYDLTPYRYLTFSVWATGLIDKTFRLTFDNDPAGEGKNGYCATLRIVRDGWTDYSLELPYLESVGDAAGWDRIESVTLDAVSRMGAAAQLWIDDLCLHEDPPAPLFTRMPEIKGAAVFSTTGAFSIVDRKRIPNAIDGAPARPFEAEGTVWVPMGTVAAGVAHTPIADNKTETLSFTYRRKKYVFEAARRYMTEDGKRVSLPFAPRAEFGMIFCPVEYVCEFFRWRQIFIDPMGLIVLSNRRGIFRAGKDRETVLRLIGDVTFLRPDGERILADLRRRFPNPTRGRLLASYEELMQLRRDAKEKPQLKEYLTMLKSRFGVGSEAFLSPALSSSSETVDSAAFLAAAERLIAFSMLYRATGDKKLCERAAAECEGLATLTDWCTSTLSTFGTVALAVALSYDWCHHMWSEARKAVVERSMLRAGMRVGLEYYDGKRTMWEAGSADAAAVGAGMLALALALCDIYPETALKLVNRVPRSLEACFAAFAPDGGIAEGTHAWEIRFRSLALAVAMLERACGDDYGYFHAPGFQATAYFPITLETGCGAWSYGDGAARTLDTALLPWLAARTNDPTPAWMRRRAILAGGKSVDPMDLLYFYEVDDASAPHLPLDSVWRGATVATMRSGWGEEDIFAGLRGMEKSRAGSLLGAGSVILDAGGVRFFCDAADGNTLVVNPGRASSREVSCDASAPLSSMRTSEERAFATVDMSGTNRDLMRATRGVLLAQNRTTVVIQDEVVASKSCDYLWTVYTPAEVTLVSGGKAAKLTLNGKTLLCRIGGVSAKFEVEPVQGSELSRLSILVKDKARLRLSVACKLLSDGDSVKEKLYDTVAISKW